MGLFKKSKNEFDVIFEALLSEGNKIKNPSEFFNDERNKRYYINITSGLVAIDQTKKIFVNEYIPIAEKIILQSKKQYKNSKFKDLIQANNQDFDELYYETIRLGYIALFHKYEAFTQILETELNLFFEDLNETNVKFKSFAKKEFNFEVYENWRISKNIKRINWINVSSKHYNGFPKKTQSNEFNYFPENSKLRFEIDYFIRDCDYIFTFSQEIFKICKEIMVFKMVSESNSDKSQNEKIIQMKKHISNIINILTSK